MSRPLAQDLSQRIDRRLPISSLCLGLLLSLGACGGGGGGGGGGSGAAPTPGVQPGNAQLISLEYGRLVDVFGFGTDGAGRTVELFAKDVMIGGDVQEQKLGTRSDDDVDWTFLSSDPDSLQPRLLITRDLGSTEFAEIFDRLDDQTRRITPGQFGQDAGLRPFSVVPRNAGLRLTFSSSLGVDDSFFYDRDDEGVITGVVNTEAVQLLEILGDPTDGNVNGDFRVVPTRLVVRDNVLIVDPVLLGSEGVQLETRNRASGMPASSDQVGANLRLAIALEGSLSIEQVRRPESFVGLNNSGLDSVIRDFRTGNPEDNSADIAGGFVRDPEPPRIVGQIPMLLERVDPFGDAAQIVTIYKNERNHEIDLGDVVQFVDPGTGRLLGTAEVIVDPTDDFEAPEVQHVQARLRRLAGLEEIDPSNDPAFPLDLQEREAWLRANAPRIVLVATFTASRNRTLGGDPYGDDPVNFLSFTPDALPLSDGSPSPGGQNISPFAGAIIRFTKPVDLSTVRPLDSFFFATRNVVDEELILSEFVLPRGIDRNFFFAEQLDKFRTPHLVVSRLFDEDGSQTSLRLQPNLGFYLDERMRAIDEPLPFEEKRFRYFLHLVGGEEGIRDLSGNAVDFQSEAEVTDFLVIPFSLDSRRSSEDPTQPLFPDNIVASVARRFANRDEDEQPSLYREQETQLANAQANRTPEATQPLEDLFGAVTYLPDGRIEARRTSRIRQIVDNINQASPPPQTLPSRWCAETFAGLFNGNGQIIQATSTNVFLTGGIQNPLNPFGCRLQTCWREIDFSLSREDPGDFNLDVEQMYWAPFTLDPITFDEFDRISLFLGHSEFRPEPCLGSGDSLPSLRESGLKLLFRNNYAFDLRPGTSQISDQAPPHVAYADQNMVIDPQLAFFEPNGVNRFLALPEFQEPYFTWRDESLSVQGGDAGIGSDIDLGWRFPPYILTPFQAGAGRQFVNLAPDGQAPQIGRIRAYWNNAAGHNLTPRLIDPNPDPGGAPGGPGGGGGNLVPTNVRERFSGGGLGSIALPLLADFWTYADDPDLPAGGGFIASGFNGWQVSFALQSEARPDFRVYSGGWAGFGSQQPIRIGPESGRWGRARGGFTPLGIPTNANDNTIYWIMADFLKRQSMVTAGFVDIYNPHRIPEDQDPEDVDPRLGPFFAGDGSTLPVGSLPRFDWLLEPAPQDLPNGTSVTPEFRLASRVDDQPWRWMGNAAGGNDPTLPSTSNYQTSVFATGPLEDRRVVNEPPDAINFPLNPFMAGDAGIRKWDDRELPNGTPRNHWGYFYNRQVTGYRTDLNEAFDPNYLNQFVGPNEQFTGRDVRYFNWRFLMKNNVEANPPLSPTLESFSVTYRFERQ